MQEKLPKLAEIEDVREFRSQQLCDGLELPTIWSRF